MALVALVDTTEWLISFGTALLYTGFFIIGISALILRGGTALSLSLRPKNFDTSIKKLKKSRKGYSKEFEQILWAVIFAGGLSSLTGYLLFLVKN
ncbi:MAG: hypothetical protein HN392_05650 [Anaerolineae bacterium]|jgi:hypothetical protein|nr:hypothetical protein [Anaerolineae bacterium]MBT7073491.1 hypothetical protein [Anaerolineae bacterium]MBT7782142.1 hypothetical protein [Anaerolineae bacterium]